MGESDMPKKRTECFSSLGHDIKEARKALGLSRRVLAEMVNIVPRYLANIENSGSLPSLPVFYELVKICKLPVEHYFSQSMEDKVDPQRERVINKLNLCREKYLPIIEATVDGALKMDDSEETE